MNNPAVSQLAHAIQDSYRALTTNIGRCALEVLRCRNAAFPHEIATDIIQQCLEHIPIELRISSELASIISTFFTNNPYLVERVPSPSGGILWRARHLCTHPACIVARVHHE